MHDEKIEYKLEEFNEFLDIIEDRIKNLEERVRILEDSRS